MNWNNTPIDEIREIIRIENDPKLAIKKIIEVCRNKIPSSIWAEFEGMKIEQDILDAEKWLKESFDEFPEFKGIYFGLDTLNMGSGNGSNIEIGLSKSCDPKILSDEWTFNCEFYGKNHLIKGLHEISSSFLEKNKWNSEVRAVAEYVIFLGYSGIILRDSIKKLNISTDYLSIWGFHDGDMFFLSQRRGGV